MGLAKVLKCCETIAYAGTQQTEVMKMPEMRVDRIDVATKLKDMW